MPSESALRKVALKTASKTAQPAGAGDRRPFTLSGRITQWSAASRELSIFNRDVQLAPHVSLAGLELGIPIVVAGYHDPATGGMVVTRLLISPT
jgi:hypothetical protein